MPRYLPVIAVCLSALTSNAAVDSLTKATVMELHNVVRLREQHAPQDRPARKSEEVKGDDLLHTGRAGSMVQIGFNDHITIARLGSQSEFSFSPTGSLNIATGLALVTVQGGKVVCETCALLAIAHSTAIIESFSQRAAGRPDRCATKIIMLEGNAEVFTRNGKTRTLQGGQMMVQFADEPDLAEVQEVDLKRLLQESRIVTGFQSQLPSMAKIQEVVDRQQRELWLGKLEPTPLTIGGRGAKRYHQSKWDTDIEAPFDPDVSGGVKENAPPCPTCP